MRFLNVVLHWIAIRFYVLYRWQETHDIHFDYIGDLFSQIGKRVYPDAYCEHCGTFIDPLVNLDYYDGYVFNGGTDKKFERPRCGSCERGPTEKQLEIYRQWRVKHPVKQKR